MKRTLVTEGTSGTVQMLATWCGTPVTAGTSKTSCRYINISSEAINQHDCHNSSDAGNCRKTRVDASNRTDAINNKCMIITAGGVARAGTLRR
jgi:hypothetical protein